MKGKQPSTDSTKATAGKHSRETAPGELREGIIHEEGRCKAVLVEEGAPVVHDTMTPEEFASRLRDDIAQVANKKTCACGDEHI